MKITFEGATMREILDDMQLALDAAGRTRLNAPENISQTMSEKPTTTALPAAAKAQGPGPDPFNGETPVDKPVDKPVDIPVNKQAANIEKARAAKAAKAAAAKIAAPEPKPAPPETKSVDPAEMVKIRQKTIEDLQTAYANGQQKEVFDLLSKFGNGAKSFRELPPDAFVPIREAIDNGALK